MRALSTTASSCYRRGQRIRIAGLEYHHRHRHWIPLMLEEQREVACFHIAQSDHFPVTKSALLSSDKLRMQTACCHCAKA